MTVDDLRAAWLRRPALKPRKERSRSEFSFGPYQPGATRLSQIACPASFDASRLRLQPRVDLLFHEKSRSGTREPVFRFANSSKISGIWAGDSRSRSEMRTSEYVRSSLKTGHCRRENASDGTVMYGRPRCCKGKTDFERR